MPDWSHLSISDRFSIALRLVPTEHWEGLLDREMTQVRRYESGTEIPLTVMAALAAETAIPMEWFVTGRGMDRKAPLVRITPDQPHGDAEDVAIQKLSFRAAAGRGELILDETASYVRVPRFILQLQGVPAQHARLMQAAGESMKDTINDGDLMLVDISPSATQIVEGKIYVFSIGNEAFVKRLRKLGDRLMMISDNRDMFPEEEVPAHLPLRVYGRVKWAGRSM